MKKFTLVGMAALLAMAGCKRKPQADAEISPEVRAQAAQFAGEGEFSTQVRDYAAAEQSMLKAIQLDPVTPRYWKELGSARKHLGNTSGARDAYQKSFDLLEAARKKNAGSGGLVLGEVETLVLMGKNDDAKELLQKTAKDFPKDETLRQMIDNKIVDKMAADPTIKASIL
jgi:Flp pilus assembly protein TadD